MNLELDIISKAYQELAKFISKNVPEVKWIDLWADQLFSGTAPAYPFPAVFIEVNANNIESVGSKVQHLDVDIAIHLAYDSYAKSYQGSFNQEAALKFGGIQQKIFKCLQGYSGQNIHMSMNRIALRRDAAPPYIYHYIQTFKSILTDDAAFISYDRTVDGVELSIGEKKLSQAEVEVYPNPEGLKFDVDQ